MDPRRADARRTRSVSAGIGEDQQLRIAELIDLTLLQLDELIDVWCELNALGRQHYLALGLSRNARPVPGREACSDALDLPQSQTLWQS
jgi:hypothetical protein